MNSDRRRGASMVESALSLLAFLLMILGIMEFGRLVWMFNTVSYLAREGTRFASVRGQTSKLPATTATVKAAVAPQAIGMDSTQLNVTLTWIPDNKPGSAVRVEVSYPYSAMAPLIPVPSTLRATSQMVITQ